MEGHGRLKGSEKGVVVDGVMLWWYVVLVDMRRGICWMHFGLVTITKIWDA